MVEAMHAMQSPYSAEAIGLMILEELKLIRKEMKAEIMSLKEQWKCTSENTFVASKSVHNTDGCADEALAETNPAPIIRINNPITGISQYGNKDHSLIVKSSTVNDSLDHVDVTSEIRNPSFTLSPPLPMRVLENQATSASICENSNSIHSPNQLTEHVKIELPEENEDHGFTVQNYRSLSSEDPVSLPSLSSISLPSMVYMHRYRATMKPIGQSSRKTIAGLKQDFNKSATKTLTTKQLLNRSNNRMLTQNKDGARRQLQCGYCGKWFHFNCHLKVHLRAHTGERPYKCRICGNQYTQRGNLNYHLKTIHGKDTPSSFENVHIAQ